MPGLLVQKTAQMACPHEGRLQPQKIASRVKLGGIEAVFLPTPLVPSSCPLTAPNGAPAPCTTVTFSEGTRKVTSMKQPLLLDSSQRPSVSAVLGPQGNASINGVQDRVKAK